MQAWAVRFIRRYCIFQLSYMYIFIWVHRSSTAVLCLEQSYISTPPGNYHHAFLGGGNCNHHCSVLLGSSIPLTIFWHLAPLRMTRLTKSCDSTDSWSYCDETWRIAIAFTCSKCCFMVFLQHMSSEIQCFLLLYRQFFLFFFRDSYSKIFQHCSADNWGRHLKQSSQVAF